MTRRLSAAKGWLLAAIVLSSALQLHAQNKKTDVAPPAVKVGDTAPDFKLHYFDGHDLKEVSLSEYRGKKNVVLAFYVFAFTGG